MPKWPIGIVPVAEPTTARCRDTPDKWLPVVLRNVHNILFFYLYLVLCIVNITSTSPWRIRTRVNTTGCSLAAPGSNMLRQAETAMADPKTLFFFFFFLFLFCWKLFHCKWYSLVAFTRKRISIIKVPPTHKLSTVWQLTTRAFEVITI